MGRKAVTVACSTCKHRTQVGCCLTGVERDRCLSEDRAGKTMYRLWKREEPLCEVPAAADSGSHASYYVLDVTNPVKPGPYIAECQDIIEALKMDFNEGNAFKALWRRAAARLGKVKKGNENPLYDAQKVAFYGNRILKKEEQNG